MANFEFIVLCGAVACAATSLVLQILNQTDNSETWMRAAYFLIVVDLAYWRLSTI